MVNKLVVWGQPWSVLGFRLFPWYFFRVGFFLNVGKIWGHVAGEGEFENRGQ